MSLDHVAIRVKDYPAAKAFYTTILAPLGSTMLNEPAPHVCGFGKDAPTFWISTCPEGNPGNIDTPTHVAFACKNSHEVDAWYDAAIKAGATCDGKPGIRAHYHPGYYGAFVIDADGHKIEAVTHTGVAK
jgi:catechol 2,3-dioxygenase-like lactoylglutathione lyase family enzyme